MIEWIDNRDWEIDKNDIWIEREERREYKGIFDEYRENEWIRLSVIFKIYG